MKTKGFSKKILSLVLAGSITIGMTSALSGCGSKKDEVVTLDVYNMLANYSGMQTGWIADILKEKFNVRLNIIPDGSGVYETRMESGDLGDIIVWGADADRYANAVKGGLLYDWNEDDILTEFGSYIKEKMPDAIAKNQGLTKELTNGEKDCLYGIGNDVATSNKDHQMFIYNWDVRWDLYKQLGYPKVKDMDGMLQLMEDMQKLCPKDDSGNKTYAVSLWPDWDDSMVMYVKATATAYYGYDELGLGLYDPQTGTYHDALEKNGPYLTMLKFYNDLYQNGLLDPDSMTQTYEQMGEKVQNGGVLFSIFNYCGSIAYNKKEHTSKGKMMYCMKPEDATPLVYGMNTQGGNYVTSIGASSEYPELCMEVLNYFATPEGRMTYAYGPKEVCWDYDKDGNTFFTELGAKCHQNENTKIGNGHKGSFHDGMLQASFSTWSIDAENPDSNGESYNSDNWKSNISVAKSDIEQDWRDYNSCISINEYFDKGKYVVSPGTSFALDPKDTDLKTVWAQVTDEIKNSSWKAMFAKTDAEFDKLVDTMTKNAKDYGYDTCIDWSKGQADKRHKLEQALQQ